MSCRRAAAPKEGNMKRQSGFAAMLAVTAAVFAAVGLVSASPAWATDPALSAAAGRSSAPAVRQAPRRVVDQNPQAAVVAPQPRRTPIPPQVLQHNFGPSYPFGYNYAFRRPSYPFGPNYTSPPARHVFAHRVGPRWVPGYWGQQWVPQYYTYDVWMPGYYAPDGAWIQGYYDT